MEFANIYRGYLNALEEIAEEHEELTDTDVRERLHEVINWYFIWGNPIERDFPLRYSMFSSEGDELVAKATKEFIESARQIVSEVEIGENRNELIEDFSIETNSGENYDLYLGSAETVLPQEKPASDTVYGDYN